MQYLFLMLSANANLQKYPTPALQRTKLNGMLVSKNLVNSAVKETFSYSKPKIRSLVRIMTLACGAGGPGNQEDLSKKRQIDSPPPKP